MRAVRVVVVRLLVDSEQAGGLRGTLCVVPDGQPQPFATEHALLVLMRQVTNLPAQTVPPDPVPPVSQRSTKS